VTHTEDYVAHTLLEVGGAAGPGCKCKEEMCFPHGLMLHTEEQQNVVVPHGLPTVDFPVHVSPVMHLTVNIMCLQPGAQIFCQCFCFHCRLEDDALMARCHALDTVPPLMFHTLQIFQHTSSKEFWGLYS
jgi:hypothetical protein